MIDSRLVWVFLGIVIGVTIWLSIACQPSPNPDPITTTTSTTTTSQLPPPTGASNTAELQADLDDGVLVIDDVIVSDGTLKPPTGASIVFGEDGILERTSNATGAAIDISVHDVTITDLKIRGSNPCHWINSIAWNPAAIGEMYSQWSAELDAAGFRFEEQAALYIRPGSKNITINGVQANDVWGDGISISGGEDITITDLNARCVGRSGISVTEGKDIRLDGGSISGGFWWAINFEPFGTKRVEDVVIKNMTIGYSRTAWLNANGPYFNCQVYNADISDNTLLITSTRPSDVVCVGSQIKRPPGDVR